MAKRSNEEWLDSQRTPSACKLCVEGPARKALLDILTLMTQRKRCVPKRAIYDRLVEVADFKGTPRTLENHLQRHERERWEAVKRA